MERFDALIDVCRDNSIAFAYLFGSQAKVGLGIISGQTADIEDLLSDLDLGIVFKGDLPSPGELPETYASLYNVLSDLFAPLNLDLVFLQEQHSVFQANAVTGICIYAEVEDLKSLYEENVMRKAADFRPVLERYLDEHLEGFFHDRSDTG